METHIHLHPMHASIPTSFVVWPVHPGVFRARSCCYCCCYCCYCCCCCCCCCCVFAALCQSWILVCTNSCPLSWFSFPLPVALHHQTTCLFVLFFVSFPCPFALFL